MNLSPDHHQAEKILTLLDEGAARFTFQTYTDCKAQVTGKDPLARKFCNVTFNEVKDQLDDLNRRGAGIYVQVNHAENGGRGKGDITEARTVYREADEPGLPGLPMEPHIVVETSPGKKHEYLLIDRTPDLDTWAGVMNGMVEDHGSDPAALGVNRVLRLPGYYRQKDPARPHMVRIIHESGQQPYTLEQVSKIIPPRQKVTKSTQEPPAHSTSNDATGKGTAYGLAAIGGELATLAGTPEGSNRRNAELNNCAFATGQLLGGGELHDRAWVESELSRVAHSIGLNHGEIYDTIKSGIDSGLLWPRSAAPNKPAAAEQPKMDGVKVKFHFIPANEVVAYQEPPKWLIKNYLEQETVSTIFGPAECFKSFIGLDMGLCVAAGIPWHDKAVTAGSVLYLCGEGRAGIGRRIEAWSRSHNVTVTKFFVSNIAAALLDGESVNAVLAAANGVKENCGPPVLVIVDTLNRNFGPGDENSTQDMTSFISAIDTIKADLGCAIVVIHHSGVMATDRARGSSALRGALDFEYQVSRTDGDTIAETSIEFKAVKTKDHDRPPTITFRPVVVDLGRVDEDGKPITSLTIEPGEPVSKRPLKLTGPSRIAMEALKAVIGEDGKAHIDTWRQECYRRSISTSDKQDAKQKAFSRTSQSLLDRGSIETKDDLFWLAGQPGQDRTKPDNVRRCPGSKPDRQDTPLIRGVRVRADRVDFDSEKNEVDEGVFL